MSKEITIVAGPRSYGLTLQLSEEVTVYVGLPIPTNTPNLSSDEVETLVRRSAAQALKLAITDLENS